MISMKNVCLSLFIMILIICSGCSKALEKDIELTVSAAASIQDALDELKTQFERQHNGIKITYNFGSSGALQQQITKGAPVDLFLSASEEQFMKLENNGYIEKKDILVGNEIVLIVPKGKDKEIKTFEDLSFKTKKISIGIPETVPAGMYAKEYLENLNLWDKLKDKIVYAKDVRQVLTYVETNNVDAGIVYKTDALQSESILISTIADSSLHTDIVYPVGIIKSSKHPTESNLFYKFLQSKQAMEIFEQYGFTNIN